MVSFAAQEQENKQIVHQFFELLDRHDTERMGHLLVSNTNYSFHLAGMPSPVDWNEHKRLLAGVIDAFPDLHHDIVDMGWQKGIKSQSGSTLLAPTKESSRVYHLLVRNYRWMNGIHNHH